MRRAIFNAIFWFMRVKLKALYVTNEIFVLSCEKSLKKEFGDV